MEMIDDQQKSVDMSTSSEQANWTGTIHLGDQATLNHITKAHQTKTS
jgi:hypothetical protein